MREKLTIVSTCKMGPGTFEAKFVPLSKLDQVEKIIVIRKNKGPDIPKIDYYILPRFCKNPVFNALVTPMVITSQVLRHKASLILAYHYIPHYYFAFLASFLTRIPYILGQTGSDDQLLATRTFAGWFLRKVIKHSFRLNVPGKSSAEFWQSLGFDNVNVLHSSIDTDLFKPDECEKEFDFIYVGRLEGYKGPMKIVLAMDKVRAIYPTAKLAIVGYGNQESQLIGIVNKLGLEANVFFLGFQADTRHWLSKARIFVLASDNEGLPCALMEAMSCGLLCISSSVGNVPDIIQDGLTGFEFGPKDQKKLEELMIYAYQNEENLGLVKKAARDVIVSYHSHRFAVKKWELLFNDMGLMA